jgi:bifunctional DNase/RNase
MDEFEGFERVEVAGVYVTNEPDGSTPIVFLENKDEKVLPIFIGAAEAFSIQTAMENLPYPRPLTHDLLVSIIEGLDTKIERVMIDDLDNGVFYARLIIKQNGGEHEFDARPSDSIALAIRTRAPVYVSEAVMENAGVDKDKYKIG